MSKLCFIMEKSFIKADLHPIKLYTPVKTELISFLIILKQVLKFKLCKREMRLQNASRVAILKMRTHLILIGSHQHLSRTWSMWSSYLSNLFSKVSFWTKESRFGPFQISHISHCASTISMEAIRKDLLSLPRHMLSGTAFLGTKCREWRVSTSPACYLRKHLSCFEYPFSLYAM